MSAPGAPRSTFHQLPVAGDPLMKALPSPVLVFSSEVRGLVVLPHAPPYALLEVAVLPAHTFLPAGTSHQDANMRGYSAAKQLVKQHIPARS